jgi:hypothetical protein
MPGTSHPTPRCTDVNTQLALSQSATIFACGFTPVSLNPLAGRGVTSVPHQTAIIGWGSLLWERGSEFDRWRDEWRDDGPSLSIEFSRVSSSRLGALTLVIDPQFGAATTVAWCLSKRKDPADAVADLRCREGCAVRYIARLNLPVAEGAPAQSASEKAITEWATARKLDAVVWTALESNFETEVHRPFSVEEAVAYIKRLAPTAKVRAAEYLWRAPDSVRTPVRTALENTPWFHGAG